VKSFFPDTNFFFECRKASDLPWHELPGVAQNEEIRLIVPAAVVTEIERHKSKGNSRTAKRARDASALLRKALESRDHRTEIRGANPLVTVVIPSPIKVDFSPFPNLDPGRADHQIAAEYAARLKGNPDLTVLSDDTLLVVALHSLGFDPVLIPADWKLAPEKDERDDKIDELQQELKNFKQNVPEITIGFLDVSGTTSENLTAEIEKFTPSKNDYDRASAAYQLKFREETNFQADPPQERANAMWLVMQLNNWQTPTEEEIRTYKQEYRRWEGSVHSALPKIAEILNEIAHEISFALVVANGGYVNATDVRVTVTGFDGVYLMGALDEEDELERAKKFLLPLPPNAPRGRYWDVISGFEPGRGLGLGRLHNSLLRHVGPRDPNRFYYVDGWPSRPVAEVERECKALPRQVDPSILEFRAFIREDELGSKPRLRVRIRASNLKNPLERYLPVSVSTKSGDFGQKLAEIQRQHAKSAGERY
jgi:hypothetical protein